jgi:hypothetical protein
MKVPRYSEAAFEMVLESRLLTQGYSGLAPNLSNRYLAMFTEIALIFIRKVQPREWVTQDPLRNTRWHLRSSHGMPRCIIAAAVAGQIDLDGAGSRIKVTDGHEARG